VNRGKARKMIYERLDEAVNGETSTRAIRAFKEIRSKERKVRRRLNKDKSQP
jgi:hypothetical protein